MNEFKGTKGKWEIVNTEVKDFSMTSVICEGEVIAHVVCKKEFRKANALLISKAPEMLEMLQEIKDQMEDGRAYITKDDISKLIKSATEL